MDGSNHAAVAFGAGDQRFGRAARVRDARSFWLLRSRERRRVLSPPGRGASTSAGCARRVADAASGRVDVRERGRRAYAQALEDRGDPAGEQAADLSHVRVTEAAEQVAGPVD